MTEMRTLTVAILAVALVVALPASGAIVAEDAANESDLSSGESLSGALSAHETDLDGEVDQRALGTALQRADDEEARAALLADRRLEAERRIETLAERRDQLRAEREAGNISETAYRVRAAELAAEARQVRRLLATVDRESRSLPDSLRAAYGLDDAALNRSLARANATADAEFEATLAAMVGDDPEPSAEQPRTSLQEATTRELTEAESRYESLAGLVDSLAANDVNETVIQCARANLTATDTAIETARTAMAENRTVTTERALVNATTDLRNVHACLETLDAGWLADDWNGDYEFNESDFDREFNESDYNTSGWNESEYNTTRDWNESDFDEDDHDFNKSDFEDYESRRTPESKSDDS